MKIAIDVSAIVYGTGVSVYTRNLVQNLLKIDQKNEYLLFGGSLRRGGEIRQFYSTLQGVSFQGRVLPTPPTVADFVWNRVHTLPIERFLGSVDVFHASDWTQPPSKAFNVTTVHDLTPILYPEWSHPKIVTAHKARLKWVKREADRVIVPSEATADDAQKLGIKRDKIRVISEGVDEKFKKADAKSIERVKKKYKIKGKYLISVGVNKRKNTDRIIEALKYLHPDQIVNLVVIGHKFDEFRDLSSNVIFTGHVDDGDMPALYSGAEALVYPSFYEGFGLPILEAFACEIPVVTSNFGSMKEVGGSSAVFVDPNSAESIADGIGFAMKNGEKLVKLGIKEVKKYSWLKAAEETLKVYLEAK